MVTIYRDNITVFLVTFEIPRALKNFGNSGVQVKGALKIRYFEVYAICSRTRNSEKKKRSMFNHM